jgi:hypothetical protein
MIPLLIVLVTYLNAPTPTITPTQIASQVATANAQLSAYSYGTFPGFQPTVVGPYIAPINKPAAFSVSDTFGPIQDILATLGQAFYDSFPSKWFAFNTGGRAAGNGTVTYAPNLGSLTHELVHHLGPGEANSMVCDPTQCRFVPYGDVFDIMGSLSGGHPNPSTKRSLKWLDAPGLPMTQRVTASGRYTIEPYETATGGVKALVLTPGVDIRRGTFSELFISARGGTNVGLHTCCSLLHDLDLSSTAIDYQINIGQSVIFGGVQITTVSASSTGAVIDVNFTPSAPPPPQSSPFRGDYWAVNWFAVTGVPTIPTSPPNLSRGEAGLMFAWLGSPGLGIGSDYWVARFTGSPSFTAGTYTFTATANDGLRLYVDGGLVIDQWKVQTAQTWTVTLTLADGPHQIVAEYFERTNAASLSVAWTLAPPPSLCVTDPLVPAVSVNAPNHQVTWTGAIVVTDERACTVQVKQ